MKRVLAMVLLCLMALACLAPATAGEESVVTPPGEFPIVNEPVTLRFFAPQSANIPDMETNAFTTMYEEKTGVHIEWELAPSNVLSEKKSISLASGNWPDAYLGAGMTREEQMLYGTRGVFVALNDLIEQYNPNLLAMIEEAPLVEQIMYAADGNIYSFPGAESTLHITVPTRMWINTTWLEQLGMDVPTTTEEYYQLLKAFSENDLNGNGEADEIPLILSSVYGDSGIAFLMCPFIYYDGVDGLNVDENDVVSTAYTTDEWREGLRYIHRLYDEQLLDSSSFTVTGDQIKQLVENADAMIVGCTSNMAPSSFANLSGERHKNYDALTPLVGPEGEQWAVYKPYAGYSTGSLVITSACEHPEIIARWVDYLYTWEGALTAREGVEGVNWERPAEGTLSYTGQQATWGRISAYGEASNYKWDGIGFPHNMLMHPEQASNTDIYATDGQPARLYAASQQYLPYVPDKVYPPVYIDPDVIKDYSKMKTDINKYVEDYTVRFITGTEDIDSDEAWQRYLDNFETLQLNEYVRISQEAYDVFKGNLS